MNIEREREEENFRKENIANLPTFTLPDETMYQWHGNPYKRGHGPADIFPTSCVSLEPPSSQPIDHLVNIVTRLLDTRYSFIAANDDRREEKGRGGDVEKGDRYTGIRRVIESTAHGQPCWYTIMRSNAPNVGGRSSEADLVWRRFFRGNKGYQAFIIRQRRVGRASGVIHDSLENARGSGNGNRFGNLFAPSHSVQFLSLVGIRNCVKLRVNSRWIFILFSFFFWLFCSLEISWNVSFALLF